MALVRGRRKQIKAREYTAVQASALSMSSGLVIYVTTTDATFTSTGLWMCENGGWVKV